MAAENPDQATPPPPLPPSASKVYLIDLPAALQLAERNNPDIAIGREAILLNLALEQQAKAMTFPTLIAGGNLHIHRGVLERDTGEILAVDSQSLYFGGGAGAVGAGTVPIAAVRVFFPLSDALLEPLVARQYVAASRFDAQATGNTVLLEVATRYLALMGAQAQLDAYRRTESDVAGVGRAVNAFVKVGQARQADADRAQSRALLIRNEVLQVEEGVAVASARLARVLDLDPAVRLETVSGPIQPVDLVDPSYDLASLLAIAQRCRPEIYARAADIAAAEARWRQERWRPLLPTIFAGFSGGEFGGGSNLAGERMDQFAGRNDFDVGAVWTLENAGIGNRAAQRTRRAQVEQATADRTRTIDQVRREVAEALAESTARRRQMDWARRQLATAETGFREELIRTRGGEGLPIETLNSLELLARARQDAIAAVVEYDQAQFRLFVSLGDSPSVAASLPESSPTSAGSHRR